MLYFIQQIYIQPHKMLTEKDDGTVEPLFNWEFLNTPRQKFKKTFKPNGAIYISKIDNFLKTKNLYQKPLETYLMNKESSIDIDNFEDLEKVKKHF